MNKAKNVLGEPLQLCCLNPLTGYFRDGYCRTVSQDKGTHVIAAIMSDEFLIFSKSRGNDLSTPIPQYNFKGLKSGDRWCLCATRWVEAYEAGFAPKVILESTDEKALNYATLEMLVEYSFISNF